MTTMAPALRPLSDTTNQERSMSSSPKRRRMTHKSTLLASSIKSSPTCTISLENVTVSSSASSDCITTNHSAPDSLDVSFQFPSFEPPSAIHVAFPPSARDENSEPELEAGSPKRRRTSRSVCTYTLEPSPTNGSTGKKRRSSKHRRSASITHHSLLSPAASTPLITATTNTPRRFANAEVRFAAMVRRAALSGLTEDVHMIDLSLAGPDAPMVEDEEGKSRREAEEILAQNVELAERLGKYLAEKGFQLPPLDVDGDFGIPSSPSVVLFPPVPSRTPTQLVAHLIMRHHDRSAARSRSWMKEALRASSPLSR